MSEASHWVGAVAQSQRDGQQVKGALEGCALNGQTRDNKSMQLSPGAGESVPGCEGQVSSGHGGAVKAVMVAASGHECPPIPRVAASPAGVGDLHNPLHCSDKDKDQVMVFHKPRPRCSESVLPGRSGHERKSFQVTWPRDWRWYRTQERPWHPSSCREVTRQQTLSNFPHALEQSGEG